MPKANVLQLKRAPEERKTFTYSDDSQPGQVVEMELRRLPNLIAEGMDTDTSDLVKEWITGEGQPGGKPKPFPPTGTPPRVINNKDIKEGTMAYVAYLLKMQTADPNDLDNYYGVVDLVSIAADWKPCWDALKAFANDIIFKDASGPKAPEESTGNGSESTASQPESTVSISA